MLFLTEKTRNTKEKEQKDIKFLYVWYTLVDDSSERTKEINIANV